jgi:hypothetical protein
MLVATLVWLDVDTGLISYISEEEVDLVGWSLIN